MKAIAVVPGKKNSAHLAEVPPPQVTSVGAGRGVVVRVLRVGVDGTDREINAAEYGAAPPGEEILILGHESFGVVEEVGRGVVEFRPGDYVVATVRRPGRSVYDAIGRPDLTTDDVYWERGINLLHGFLSERYVDSADHIVAVPRGLAEEGVLLEPLTVAEKGIAEAFEVQRRLRVWHPRRAAVTGSGTLGLLAALVLRLRGLEVTVFGRTPKPNRNAALLEGIGAHYLSTGETTLAEAARPAPFDLLLEGSGFSPLAFDAMQALAKNGVLVLLSVTGGARSVEVPTDRINLDFVLGNRAMLGSVNASREHFEAGVRDMALAEATYPGFLKRLLTHPVRGLERVAELFETLGAPGTIKVFCEVAPL